MAAIDPLAGLADPPEPSKPTVPSAPGSTVAPPVPQQLTPPEPQSSQQTPPTTRGGKSPLVASRFVPDKAPIAFNAFALIDPSTGKTVDASATIKNRANGKMVNAGEYWRLVNQLEAELNTGGRSLREHVSNATITYARLKGSSQTELATTPKNIAPVPFGSRPNSQTGNHSDVIKLGPNSPPPASVPTPDESSRPITAPSASPLAMQTGPIPAHPSRANCVIVAPKKCGHAISPLPPWTANGIGTISSGVTWNPQYGNSGTAQVYLRSTLSAGGTAGSNDPVDLEAKFAAGGYILGAGGDIASANASIAHNTASIDANVLGQTLISKNANGGIKDNPAPYDVNLPGIAPPPIPIGPIDLTVSLQITGKISYPYDLEDTGNAATASFTPEIKLTATLSVGAGVDLGVISGTAGFTGNILLLDLNLNPSKLSLGFTLNESKDGLEATGGGDVYACQLQYGLNVDVVEKHSFLAGTVNVFVQGCVDLFVWSGCDTWSKELFNWSGINGSSQLVNTSVLTTNVGPVYTDLPEYGTPLSAGQVFSPDDAGGMPEACEHFGFGTGTPKLNDRPAT